MSRLVKKLEVLSQTGNDAEMRIAIQLLKPEIDISEMSAIALGRICGVSNASIVRFAQNLGYKGYSVFKFDFIAMQKHRANQSLDSDLNSDYSVQDIINKSSYLLMSNLQLSLDLISDVMIQAVSDLIINAQRVVIIGFGPSSNVAMHITQKLMVLNKAVLFQPDNCLQESYLQQVDKNDVVMILSAHGETERINSRVKKAKRSGCKVISITRDDYSELHALSDITLPFVYNDDHWELMGSSVQIFQLAIFDIIFYRLIALKDKMDDQRANDRQEIIAQLGRL